jgi:hypothetical protein
VLSQQLEKFTRASPLTQDGGKNLLQSTAGISAQQSFAVAIGKKIQAHGEFVCQESS